MLQNMSFSFKLLELNRENYTRLVEYFVQLEGESDLQALGMPPPCALPTDVRGQHGSLLRYLRTGYSFFKSIPDSYKCILLYQDANALLYSGACDIKMISLLAQWCTRGLSCSRLRVRIQRCPGSFYKMHFNMTYTRVQ